MKVPSSVAPSVLFDLLLAEWHLPAPNLVVSLVGEERPFAVKSWLRDVLRKGLVKAAQSTGDARHGQGPRAPAATVPAGPPSTVVHVCSGDSPWGQPGHTAGSTGLHRTPGGGDRFYTRCPWLLLLCSPPPPREQSGQPVAGVITKPLPQPPRALFPGRLGLQQTQEKAVGLPMPSPQKRL